jgi:NADH:ubiquinone oxidoreductase subunit 6 (subunit J)
VNNAANASFDPMSLNSIAFMLWFTIVIYNGAIIGLFKFALPNIDWNKALTEKRYRSSIAATATSAGNDISYSRAIGTVGGVVMVGLFWAVGNMAIFFGFEAPLQLLPLLKNIWPLFAAGSALFLPYAFNQLSGFFSSNK